MKDQAIILGSIAAFIGVALGAFGAHGLHDQLVANERLATWDTAVLYEFVHAGQLLILGILLRSSASKLLKWAQWASFVGILVFSGSLYILSLTNIKWLGAITPIGGVLFLLSWAFLLISIIQTNKSKA